MRKFAKPSEIMSALSACLSLFYCSVSVPSAQAQESAGSSGSSGSLIESALDGKYQDTSPVTTQPTAESKKSSKNSASNSKNEAVAAKASKNAKPVVKLIKPGHEEAETAKTSNASQADESISTGSKPVVKLVKPAQAVDALTVSKAAAKKTGKSNQQSSAEKPVVKLVKPVKPAADTTDTASTQQQGGPKVEFVPVPEKPLDDASTDNVKLLEPPIHSEIQTHHPQLPLFNINIGEEKVDNKKAYAIDQTYRGKEALPSVPTVTFGEPQWAQQQNKRKIATGTGVGSSAPNTVPVVAPAATSGSAEVNKAAGSSTAPGQVQTTQLYELNVRLLTDPSFQFRKTDALWAYPYPPRPPKFIPLNPLPEDQRIKPMLLQTGYSARPDQSKPYPANGWRWYKAMNNAMAKAHEGYPHTMFTMYPWVDKMFPYVRSECRELNLSEEKRSARYNSYLAEWEKSHVDLESLATSHGFVPIEMKVDLKGVSQAKLPAGNWWVTCSRAYPGLKFYWVVPVSCSTDKVINVQLNEANAVVVAGSW